MVMIDHLITALATVVVLELMILAVVEVEEAKKWMMKMIVEITYLS
jgi:hypothetical protein